MDRIQSERVFTAIKKDDVKLFSKLLSEDKGCLSLRFGRFPLLSVLYLYKSSKIINKVSKELYYINSDSIVSEPIEAYELFRSYAGKCLRLYLNGRTVSPLEMLALMGEGATLKSVYSKIKRTPEIKENIEKIYSLKYNKRVKQTERGIAPVRARLSLLQKLAIPIVLLLAATMIIIPIGVNNYVSAIFGGSGEEDAPIHISNEMQFEAAIKDSGERYYYLTKDIMLKEDVSFSEYSGNLNGSGHSITLPKALNKSVIGTLNGSIENLNFIFPEEKVTVSEDFGLLVGVNRGSIKNVSVSANLTISEGSDKEKLYVSAFVGENLGDITNCTLDAKVSLVGDGNGDVYFGGFCGKNSGTLIGLTVAPASAFTADTVDIAGIVGENSEVGKVSGCKNGAALSQVSAYSEWTPNAAGIAVTNDGSITQCTNDGDVLSESTTDTENRVAISGGIVCTNNHVTSSCSNNGKITAKAPSVSVYAAGTAVTNDGSITQCVNNGEVFSETLTSNGNHLAIAGGIVCTNKSTTNSCKNNGKVTARAPSAIALVGGIAVDNASQLTVCENKGEVVGYSEKSVVFVGGICTRNLPLSIVKECNNSAPISATSGTVSTSGNLYVGGIVGENGANRETGKANGAGIEKCKNTGTVSVTSNNFSEYAGGIAGFSYGDTTIKNCSSSGKLYAKKEATGSIFIFVGGIVGGSMGHTEKSFTSCSYETIGENSFVGGIFGMAYGSTFFYSFASSSENYYCKRDNVAMGIGTVVDPSNNTLGEGANSETTEVAEEEDLKALEVYWE